MMDLYLKSLTEIRRRLGYRPSFSTSFGNGVRCAKGSRRSRLGTALSPTPSTYTNLADRDPGCH
jgi:hypothetical protein